MGFSLPAPPTGLIMKFKVQRKTVGTAVVKRVNNSNLLMYTPKGGSPVQIATVTSEGGIATQGTPITSPPSNGLTFPGLGLPEGATFNSITGSFENNEYGAGELSSADQTYIVNWMATTVVLPLPAGPLDFYINNGRVGKISIDDTKNMTFTPSSGNGNQQTFSLQNQTVEGSDEPRTGLSHKDGKLRSTPLTPHLTVGGQHYREISGLFTDETTGTGTLTVAPGLKGNGHANWKTTSTNE